MMLDRSEIYTLLQRSYELQQTGDREAARQLVDLAVDLDVAIVIDVVGGIQTGEVPHPLRDPTAWADYAAEHR